LNAVNRPTGFGATLALVVAQVLPVPMLAPIALAPAAAQSGNQYNTRPQTVPCYSNNGGTNNCRLPDNTVSVSFVGPDRSGRCREGQTWRRVGNSIQVQQGCGGNFEALVRTGGSGGGWGGSGGSGGGGWGGSGGSGQGFAGELICRSRDGREEVCNINGNSGGRVEMIQQLSSTTCIEGRNWRADRNRITVRAGCQARFGYGYGNGGGSGGGWGGSNQGFAGQLECRSQDNRYRRCGANTDNRVEMLRQFSSASCVRGRSWGFDRGSIWVDNGCQARFGYGYGNVQGNTSGDGGGSDTGAVIGGVALAAGLVALLAAAGKSSSNDSSSRSAASSTATLTADLNQFPSDARAPAQACLNEAARQVGATGGTAVKLDRVDGATRSGEGWMILARLTATYPNQSQSMAMDCRATGDKVTAFDVR
jgi:hypothetical protein